MLSWFSGIRIRWESDKPEFRVGNLFLWMNIEAIQNIHGWRALYFLMGNMIP
jgi:hypothetical protein